MAKRAYASAILTTPRGRAAVVINTERRRAVREAIAAKIEVDLALGAFDDACDCVDDSDKHLVDAIVGDLIRVLRTAGNEREA